MYIFRLFGLAGLLCCFSIAAQAQYTTKSSSASASGFTNKKTAAVPAEEPVEKIDSPVAAAPAARPNVYRPRPKAVEDTGEEDLPSFSAFEKPEAQAPQRPANPYARPAIQGTGAAVQGSAQGSQAGQGSNAVPKVVAKPKGEVWVYSTDFKMDKVGRFPFCSFKRVLQNRTDSKIERLSIEFSWPGYTTEKIFQNLEPKASDVAGFTLYLDTCPAMNTKPKIKIKTCRIGEVFGPECEKYVIVK